jgi:PHD/YefM family antitoxin component YafN of YafNO toxin-antitoxin module
MAPLDTLSSSDARTKLPKLIEQVSGDPTLTVAIGRQRRREVVLVSAQRFDEFTERERLVGDLAWALFAQARVDAPTSAPVSWEEAMRRRMHGAK